MGIDCVLGADQLSSGYVPEGRAAALGQTIRGENFWIR